MTITEFAPAKVNLNLHVGPLRADGRHDLSSLIVFAGVGDVVRVAPAARLSLAITGPFAEDLAGEDVERNLVLRAARRLVARYGVETGAEITLEKRLPVASGVGGGSADAAAALRALIRLWRLRPGANALDALAFGLGADVPVCLRSRTCCMEGAGERLRAAAVPPVHIALANPRVATPTGPVFRAFDRATPNPPPPATPPAPRGSLAALADFMAATRNDLQAPAIGQAPVVREVIETLAAAPGALAARMSGSGATCFALFPDAASAARAARRAGARGWWSASAPLVR
ncbi:MAG: 4-(cytidine 5'-diphospho)-2-C-methyl-D-erythritol kinase [Pseudomonadota bacterium]